MSQPPALPEDRIAWLRFGKPADALTRVESEDAIALLADDVTDAWLLQDTRLRLIEALARVTIAYAAVDAAIGWLAPFVARIAGIYAHGVRSETVVALIGDLEKVEHLDRLPSPLVTEAAESLSVLRSVLARMQGAAHYGLEPDDWMRAEWPAPALR